MKHRFMTTVARYATHGAVITPQGLVTDDGELVKRLRKSPDFNIFFYEVATEEELASANVRTESENAQPQSVLPSDEPCPVKPLAEPDAEAEARDAAEQASIIAAQEQAEAEMVAEKKAKQEYIREVRAARGKKGGKK